MQTNQSEPWIDLTGRVAIVTGAASGIGRAAAIALCQAGATTVFADIDSAGADAAAQSANERGGNAHARTLDVSSQAGWRSLGDTLRGEHQRLDILVNSAGIALSDRVGDAALEAYRRTFAVNVEGALNGMALALEFMRAAGRGAIVNVASTASLKGNPIMASYGASKAALAHFTRSAALENVRAGHDIRINSVHPGLVDTAMADQTYAHFSKLGSPKEVISHLTTGRPARPEEIADLILFLASDRASFISGASINIDRAHSA
jgi:NAD(P)-dependent dehydrogenase (short-subunit alcohol dehydrogenase family)